MRTTVTLDSDVAQEIELLRKQGRPFKQIVNEAMRLGLRQLQKPPRRRRYSMPARNMGLRPGFNLDNIADLLAHAEGEDWR